LGQAGFRIESNFVRNKDLVAECQKNDSKQYLKNIRNFGAQLPRNDKDVISNLSDSRFEIINRTPECLSKIPRVPGFSMTGMLKRQDLFGKSESGSFYDAKHSLTKARLDAGMVDIKRMKDRKGSTLQESGAQNLSCVNMDRAIDARTTTIKPRAVNLTFMRTTAARDDSMFKQGDRMENIHLENTKSERELELKARASAYKNQPLYFQK
jgi:hypothetical protein